MQVVDVLLGKTGSKIQTLSLGNAEATECRQVHEMQPAAPRLHDVVGLGDDVVEELPVGVRQERGIGLAEQVEA